MSSRLGGFIAGQNINVSIGTFTTGVSPDLTFASTQATPAVGQAVQFTTTGTLPAGFSLNTPYYVISTSTNTCRVSTTQGGSATTYSSAGSGTHTAVTQRAFNPYAGAPDTVEYLVVAGGGGGGGGIGGGGGAGGLLTAAGFAVAAGTALTVTVGAGGPSNTAQANGTNGNDSVFSSITALGGGGGGGNGVVNANSGGSGGGSSDSTGGAGAGTPGQGFSGGGPVSTSSDQSGGGGGSGSVGGNGPIGGRAGDGGTGTCSTITGQRVFYAGGGGGASYNVANAGGLGVAGGGNGGTYQSVVVLETSGTANTGGGCGGAVNNGVTPTSAGGSGIVIIRYPQINSAPALVTGSPQVSYSDGYQIYTWTSSGSIIF